MKTIGVIGRKGGCGKTLLSVNLAAALSGAKPVTLLDTDPQGSASGWIADSPALRVRHIPEAAALERALREPGDGFRVVDTPPLDPAIARMVAGRSDLILLPASPSLLDLRALVPVLDGLAGSRINALVVLNQVDARARVRIKAREALEAMGAPVARTELGRRTAHIEAVARRQAVIHCFPGSKAAAEILALAREIKSTLRR